MTLHQWHNSWLYSLMMYSIITQALLYLCFLVLMILVTGRCLFLVMQWFFRWMVS
jgi:hypothetical protein